MTLEEYGDFVTELASPDSMVDFKAKLATAGLGMSGEAGEVADITKKVLFHGLEWNEEVKAKFIKEIGDIMWYMAFAARNVLNMTVEEIVDANVAKLQDRYKSGKFTTKEFLEKENRKRE